MFAASKVRKYTKIKEALKVLSDRFAIVNKEIGAKIEEAAQKRLEELQRAKRVL